MIQIIYIEYLNFENNKYLTYLVKKKHTVLFDKNSYYSQKIILQSFWFEYTNKFYIVSLLGKKGFNVLSEAVLLKKSVVIKYFYRLNMYKTFCRKQESTKTWVGFIIKIKQSFLWKITIQMKR